jgi:hypothetical protein
MIKMSITDIITDITCKLQDMNPRLKVDDYVECILNIFLVRDGIRKAYMLELSYESNTVIDLFKSLIITCQCVYQFYGKDMYITRPETVIPNFLGENFNTEVGKFLGYPYSDRENMIKNKYKYYIKIIIGEKVYDLYAMACASKKYNERARLLERRCREYFDMACPKSCLVYGYTKKQVNRDL